MRISKSKFVAGVQCLKRLYWQVHEPEQAAEPDAADEAIMEQGTRSACSPASCFPVDWRLTVQMGSKQRFVLPES